MLGAIYAILSAASFGFNNASARRGVISGTALQGLTISMPMGVLVFVIGATMVGEWGALSGMRGTSIFYLSAAGFMHFLFGRYFNIRSLAAIGSNLAGPVQQLQLLFALILAILFLGETLSPLKVIGILLIVSAPAYILRHRAKQKVEPKTDFKPRMAEGYTCAFLAAIGFGASPVLIKAGLGETNLSFLGGFVSYVAAFAILSLVLFAPGQRADLKGLTRESAKWFIFSGIGSSVSNMFRFLALGIAPVTIVLPLGALSLLFRMIFGYFINRDFEQFDRYVIIGVGLSFVGAVMMTISSDLALQHLDAPDWILNLSRWTWP